MSADLLSVLFKRRSQVDSGGETWESKPEKSIADATHLKDLKFGEKIPSAQQWLQQLEVTPEEDMLTEALADGMIERRQALPAHFLATMSKADTDRLSELAAALAKMQRDFAAEHASLGEQQEELTRREAELRAREEEIEAERNAQQRREEERRNYPQPTWLENIEGTMNIGVLGNSGVGKSLLINKLRRLRPGAHDWAPVGVIETTREPTMYKFPGQPDVRLWDLPGAGTAAVPSETYIQDMGLRYFDKVLICTAHRFTSIDVELRAELENHKVPFYMVRTKVDIDVWNNQQDNRADEKTTLKSIRDDLLNNHGLASVFLVSSREPESYDMTHLVAELFPGMKRQMDSSAPHFCPAAPAWNDAWAMPIMFSAVMTGLQGRWYDGYSAVYLVQGGQVHVTLSQGHRALVTLTEINGRVWWCNRWFVDEESVRKARCRGELRWSPVQPSDENLVWWWSD
mmetsp:Transcript_50086/g.126243  ORF Transcript_50086/g.126243 Transcript_50086/m.126243 type:complete len:458 (+) Transcript_50086:210-1583(+)|eukprot:CAMPEP_0115219358 /NCGR_PEP_ID=MMETSP0270-20121206/26875_1 /TAXON_ID=71861 /ORGANISM="Scrippsiella trochoidea, Strain CCMP3099" /LENGTH=457 /DNA_ID=CAMNT_0002633349 /DNA_START=203 /DNA_END=1576 /DNA_ORIENTATION=+